jgi:hypothetical protein
MKSPEEIKKGLECCFPSEDPDCCECPYEATESCFGARINDILAYIQQLERERDAAVEDFKEFSMCEMCKHYDGDRNCEVCAVSGCDWQWRGVQEVEG